MTMFRTGELERIQHACETLLPTTCVIATRTVVSDGGGGQTIAYNYGGTPVACRIGPVGGGEASTTQGGSTRGDQIDDRTTHVLTLAHDTVIEETDRVRASGTDYEVTAVRKRPGVEMIRRVELLEVV